MEENNQLGLLFTLVVIVVIVVFSYNYLFNNALLLEFLGGKERALMICHFVIVVTISGIMYDLLRGAPAFGVSPQGRLSLFSRRGATITEGLLFGVLMFVAEKQILKLLNLVEEEGVTLEEQIVFSLVLFVGIVFFVTLLFGLKMPWYFSLIKKTLFSAVS